MRHGSLFSGIGGFDLAAEWMGWDNVFHCEWEDFPRQILDYYWPNAQSYGDITTSDFTIYRGQIDILSGGFPCQPYSAAGKRLGKEDDRHLWPEMLRAIREIRPIYVVGENVYGLVNWNKGLVFDEVQSDLENEGYQVAPVILPAAGKNAPHRRDRVWFIAYSESDGIGELREQSEKERSYTGYELPGEQYRISGEKWTTTDTSCSKLQRSQLCGSTRKEREAQTDRGQLVRPVRGKWEDFPTQSPICGRNDGLPTELDGVTFSQWRNGSIKGYGNAIVPQIAFEIFSVIQEIHNQRCQNKNL